MGTLTVVIAVEICFREYENAFSLNQCVVLHNKLKDENLSLGISKIQYSRADEASRF